MGTLVVAGCGGDPPEKCSVSNDEGLLTEEEYAERRRAILDEL